LSSAYKPHPIPPLHYSPNHRNNNQRTTKQPKQNKTNKNKMEYTVCFIFFFAIIIALAHGAEPAAHATAADVDCCKDVVLKVQTEVGLNGLLAAVVGILLGVVADLTALVGAVVDLILPGLSGLTDLVNASLDAVVEATLKYLAANAGVTIDASIAVTICSNAGMVSFLFTFLHFSSLLFPSLPFSSLLFLSSSLPHFLTSSLPTIGIALPS
jgi:hypothetical protein